MPVLKPAKSSVPAASKSLLIVKSKEGAISAAGLSSSDAAILARAAEAKKPLTGLYSENPVRYLQSIEYKEQAAELWEAARKAGAHLAADLRAYKIPSVEISTSPESPEILLAYAEGIALGAYQFDRYKKEREAIDIEIHLSHPGLSESRIAEFNEVINANIAARDLVNEPFSHQNAEALGEGIAKLAESTGLKVEILNKARIESLKMGGLLAVNAGSIDPPTFTIIEWKPKEAVNERPVILVGKGVVYDTGGLTLKPTPNSMDYMKSDMAGAAAVAGTMLAAAKNNLPVYMVGLIPATDNRPGGRAIAPGDVITMYDGTTVEVLNTDAEGRLILADALAYAKKYKPELVIDLATLTGAAARAIGPYGIVYMATADDEIKHSLEESGRETWERLVEFPLWEEYAELIKSDIADLKNVSAGANAGAITAGKFLEHFTDYPWVHMDIAGPAFLLSADSYRGKNATGTGIRLLYNFLKNRYRPA